MAVKMGSFFYAPLWSDARINSKVHERIVPLHKWLSFAIFYKLEKHKGKERIGKTNPLAHRISTAGAPNGCRGGGVGGMEAMPPRMAGLHRK